LQRLFSTFANGWPGRGLFLQRLLTAAILFYSAITHLDQSIPIGSTILRLIGAGGGVLLLIGLWTPVTGTFVAVLELWIAFSVAVNPLLHIMVAILASTLAMIGPGASSIDARLFGRKRIETPEL
jgi:putative oxidoreductase